MNSYSPQIYLVSAITLFALPSLSDKYASTIQKIALPVMLPVAHIGMVSVQNIKILFYSREINQFLSFEGWLNFLNFGNICRALPGCSAPLCKI